ncbi:GNAT family N-acetyltransferase [Streptomyces sp. NPDC005438]|uniref:GNAT family N-acetyltransferase n=1 Tax=Streptomyces sp. NPDC005438 TaxID=3156880 RepID=UPI0033AC4C49
MSPMDIRPAEPSDLERLRDIERAAGEVFRDWGMGEVADDPPPTVAELLLHQRAGELWVHAPRGGPVLAYALALPIDAGLHVEQLSVHPDGARRGLGRALLEHLGTLAHRQGRAALTLTTFSHVPWNAPYYRRCGFHTLPDRELTVDLAAIRDRERRAGLDRWPRECMARPLGEDPPRP